MFGVLGFVEEFALWSGGGALKFALTEVEFMLAAVVRSSTVVSVVLVVGRN